MTFERIAEHSVAMHLLSQYATILDAGCRGMEFAKYMLDKGYRVISMDIDKLGHDGYLRVALGGELKRVGINKTKDPQATCICAGNDIACWDLPMVCQYAQVNMFDLIKMDIEGSEYEVIMSMNRAYAKQLSIEFHLHTGAYKDADMTIMENKLVALGYFPVSHDLTKQHGMGFNYWDSLWILKA